MRISRVTILCLVLSALLSACSDPGKPVQVPDAGAIAANNYAVGLMGQFEYAKAHDAFAKLSRQYPDWADIKLNQAIATLNRQQEGDETAALDLAREILQTDSGNLRAHYLAGLMQLYLGEIADARRHFQKVADNDPLDPFAAYYLANCLAQLNEHAQALPWYERAMALDPYLRSAYYGAFQSLQRLDQPERARLLAAGYQRLDNNPRSHLAEFKYTRMGPKGEAKAVDLADEALPSQPAGELFLEAQPLSIEGADIVGGLSQSSNQAHSFTTADLDGDGLPELFLAGVGAQAAGGSTSANLLLRGQQGGGYRVDHGHPLAAVKNINAVLWGDYDNDGLVDVYLCRRGPNQLWRQAGKDNWLEVTAASGTAGGNLDCVDGAFFDADHDGDLDLYLVNADGPNELLNNNLDGSFRPLAQEYAIDGGDTGSIMVLPVDLDNDRDVDLLVLNRDAPHRVYLNDRLWSYHEAPGFDAFNNTPALSVLAEDIDADGETELYMLQRSGELLRWSRGTDGRMQSRILGRPSVLSGIDRAYLTGQDVNGDGEIELIVSSARGWTVLAVGGETAKPLYTAAAQVDDPRLAHLALIGSSLAGPAMLTYAPASAGLSVWQPGPGRYPFVTLTLGGRQEKAQSMRSNASGIGSRVAFRSGSRWSHLQNYRNASAPGQSLQALAVGLKGAARADFIAINWSDGVFQSELSVSTAERRHVSETQRQLSSCPVLFAWNGEKFVFVSDLLGVGGIGYAIGPGEYSSPRPWENFLLPAGLLQASDRHYLLKIAEPMEEVAYLDAARLVQYDLPPGWQMVMDERMGIGGPEPSGDVIFYQREMLPQKVTNDRGENVLASLAHADGVAAPVGELDPRFIGRLQGEHRLSLEFPRALNSGPGQPVLVIDGWVEYPYSQTNFAAWQAGASFDAPSLDAAVDDGDWQPLLEQFGYPAGMPRRMSLPLTGLPDGTRKLRLRTNMQVYWDRIAVVYAQSPPARQKQALSLVAATHGQTGFAKRSTLAQFRPHYDYADSSPFWDTRYMAGYYTQPGPVEELVAVVDDAVAIIGPGEEVELEFAATGPPPAGWQRYFVLETNGWAKDMDLFTRDGETVAPMPTTGRPTAVRDRLHERYNTRYLSGF